MFDARKFIDQWPGDIAKLSQLVTAMTQAYEIGRLESADKLQAVSAELAATEARDTKGTEVIVDLTLRQDRLVEVLKVTAGNIRSLGPAGQLHEPYRPWLKTVEDAIEEATK